jgi:O-antigen ligase
MYRINIWRGCADMAGELGIAGIGVGDEAFSRMYSKYAVAGAETAYHAHSLWLGILLMLGVCGLAIFLVMTFFFYQRSFTVGSRSDDKDIGRIVAASASGVTGLLVAGLFDYTWYNYRVLFAYFVVMGFVCACDFVSSETKGGYHGCEY